MANSTNPIILLDSYNIDHDDFKTMINKRCNKNVARFVTILKILKKEFPDLEITNNMLYSYELAKKIPQAVLSLIMTTPTFNFWLDISENLIRRLLNNEKIPFKEIPHSKGIINLNKSDIVKYHFMDINRYILTMSILSYNSVRLKCPVYDGKLVIPYYSINININNNKNMVNIMTKDSNHHLLIIDNEHTVDLNNSISSFNNGKNVFKENHNFTQSESILFSKGRIIINNYDPYYKYEMIVPYIFPHGLKASSPNSDALLEWGHLMKDVQKILYNYWPEIENIIGFYLYEITPIKSPVEDMDISCTTKSFHGSIFCSEIEPYQMSETVIHEFSHSLLNEVMDNNDVFDKKCSKEEKFYSPWRPEPRHCSGILHAIYVFEKVADYYARLLKANIKAEIYEYRYSLIVSRLELAINTIINNAILTNFGQKLIDSLNKKINTHLRNLNYNRELSIKEIE